MPHAADAEGRQLLFRCRTHAGKNPDRQGREEVRLCPLGNPEDPQGLGDAGGYLGHQLVPCQACRGWEAEFIGDLPPYLPEQGRNCSVEKGAARQVEVELVDGSSFDHGDGALQDRADLAVVVSVEVVVAPEKDHLRAEFPGSPGGHGGAYSKAPGLVGSGGDNAPPVGIASHHHRLSVEGGVDKSLHGHEERVHVEVGNPAFHFRAPRVPVISGGVRTSG